MTPVDWSPVADIYDALRAANASWSVEVRQPDGPGWIRGADFRVASTGPFNALLLRIGARARTADRKTIAASFALRFGWASAMAIAPYLKHSCVPDIALENVSLKFTESTFFERTAIHEARGSMMASDARATHPSITPVTGQYQLLRALRDALAQQAAPVVQALYEWAAFSRRGTWGMLTSSWAAHLTSLHPANQDQREVLPMLREFFAGDDVVAVMQPRMHPVTYRDVTHLYQRRASCCRWYLLPQGELCASCPLVSDEERLIRNIGWMRRQLESRSTRRPGTG